MAPNKVKYICPVCGSRAIFHNVKTGVMKCSKCGNRWFAGTTDILLPSEGFEELQEGGPVCVL